jgi:hypothetical protein
MSRSITSKNLSGTKKSAQSQRFIKAAREAGASEDERVFDENLKRIVKPKNGEAERHK